MKVPRILQKQVRCPTCNTILTCSGNPGEIAQVTCPSCGMLGKVTFEQTFDTSTKIVEIQHLTKTFGKFTAVDNLDLTIYKGEIYGY
ncbi:MAG: hypothetical protein V1917_04535 [Candidatus Gottesmanbacteria bacterium]